jgi:hypothetical protein
MHICYHAARHEYQVDLCLPFNEQSMAVSGTTADMLQISCAPAHIAKGFRRVSLPGELALLHIAAGPAAGTNV